MSVHEGLSSSGRDSFWRLLLGVLLLGNVRFKRRKRGAVYVKDESEFQMIEKLLSLKSVHLRDCFNGLKSTSQAKKIRNGLMKRIYSMLLQWVLSKVNNALEAQGKDVCSNVIRVFHAAIIDPRIEVPNKSVHQFVRHYTQEKIFLALIKEHVVQQTKLKDASKLSKKLMIQSATFEEMKTKR